MVAVLPAMFPLAVHDPRMVPLILSRPAEPTALHAEFLLAGSNIHG
jgi:hypothetical protein